MPLLCEQMTPALIGLDLGAQASPTECSAPVPSCPRPSWLHAHLQFPVLLLEVFVFVRVTLWKLVHMDPKLVNLLPYLQQWGKSLTRHWPATLEFLARSPLSDRRRTLSFSFRISLGTRQSALAMSGTMFTFSCRAFMKPTSTGLNLPDTG